MLGEDARFEIEWASVYTFACRRMQRFRHGRVLFAGDAAHVVSPFGARGANSGLQDADNLVWKLALVLAGAAPERLLDTYDSERVRAADENILATRRARRISSRRKAACPARFATPCSVSRRSTRSRAASSTAGRLSLPSILADSPLNTPDRDRDFARGPGRHDPGAPAPDAPVTGPAGDWLLSSLGGDFTLLGFADAVAASDVAALARDRIPCRVVLATGKPAAGATPITDAQGLAARRYDARPGTVYLLRPDQHVCARWREFDLPSVRAAIARATCNG